MRNRIGVGGLWPLFGAISLASLASAQGNLASGPEGARIEKASSVLDPSSRADNLLDGNPATTWATGQRKVKGQYVIIRLATRRATDIGAIAVDNSVAPGHAPETALRHFTVAVSDAGTAETDFTQIKLGSCQLGGGRQVFTFSPARAEYVKLTLNGNFGSPDWIELAEVEVFAAGVPPVQRAGTPSVLLLSDAAEASGTPFARVAASLAALGATVSTAPGPGSSRALSSGALLGYRVVVISADPAPDAQEARLLVRHVERGGGLVCALPADPGPLQAVLGALGVSATPVEGAGQACELLPHWVTDGLVPPERQGSAVALSAEDDTPLAELADGSTIALAGERGAGRVVVLPEAFLQGDGSRDGVELSRRAVLWAAAMEDVEAPGPPEPVALSGKALFVSPPSSLTFTQLHAALASHGLTLADAPGGPAGFGRSNIGDAPLVMAFMPTFEALASLDIADWVRGGGALLVLGDAAAEPASLIGVNEFLREFGAAMTLSPSRDLSVAVRHHPATAGIQALSRPGEPLGVWCLQGTPLATMAGTPVAMARTFGEGRLVAMDAGFAADMAVPPADRKKAPPAYGIELEQNRDFVLRCVAWLLGED